MRKSLRTLRKSFPNLAQGLRTRILFLLAMGFGGLACSSAAPPPPLSLQYVWSGDRHFLFDAATQQFRVGPTWASLSPWRSLPSPPGMFRGHRLLPGPLGHAYWLDEVQSRLCLFDTAGQWLSCLPLPEPLQGRSASRLEVVARKDGRFAFFDADAGQAMLFREVRPGEAETRWQFLGKALIPTGQRACLERPWFSDICCLRQGKPRCYDAFLNAIPFASPDSAHAGKHGFSAKPDSAGESWVYRLPGEKTDTASVSSLCFENSRGFYSCP